MKYNKIYLLIIAVVLLSTLFLYGCGKKDTTVAEESNIENTENIEEETTLEGENLENSSQISTEISSEVTTLANTEVTTQTATTSKGTNSSAAISSTPTTAPRIVATSPAVCDIMDRLGIDLVGVPESTASTIPARYSKATRVGSAMEPDMEILKSLKPTDIITPDTLKDDLKIKYDNIGASSTFVNLRSVQGLYDTVKLLGDKYGKSTEAASIIKEYTQFIQSYSNKHSGKAKPKVLVLMGLPGSYLVATNSSYAGSLVELAGGTNVFQDSTNDFINVNTEEILAKDPDVIIRTAHGLPKEALAMFEKEFSTNDIWKHFRAVQNNKVYDVDYTLFGMSASFDYPQALADLEPMLYGE